MLTTAVEKFQFQKTLNQVFPLIIIGIKTVDKIPLDKYKMLENIEIPMWIKFKLSTCRSG